MMSDQASLARSRCTLARSRSGLASWEDSTTDEHSVKKSSTPLFSARSMKGLYVAFFRFRRGFFDEYGSRTMSWNASVDELVQAFVRTQSILRGRSLLAGALRFGRFAGVRLGGGLGSRRCFGFLGSIGVHKFRRNQSMFGIDGLVVGIGPQRPGPGPRAGYSSFAGLGRFVRRRRHPKIHLPMRALEPQQRLGRELRYQLLRVDLALRSRRRRLGRVAFDEAL
mmetsp:Transcript_20898/g.59105  ORF Transcript_20898/g.59105 Transcript_20898/m.59105 type:complete len:224 (+) Transcript_20898:208-879(+)